MSADEELGAELAALFAQVEIDRPCLPALVAVIDGSATPADREAVLAHAESCAACRADLDSVDTAPLIPPARRRSPLRWVVAATVAAAAAVALFFGLRSAEPPPTVLTAKGGFRLHVGVERDGREFRLDGQTPLRAGDRIGLFYDATEPGYVAAYFVDDGGALTALLDGAGVGVVPGREASLPAGGVLQTAEGCEYIVGLFSPKPMSATRTRAIVEHMAAGAVDCRLAAPPADLAPVQVDSRVVPR